MNMNKKDLEDIMLNLDELRGFMGAIGEELVLTENHKLRECAKELSRASEEIKSWIDGIERELMPEAKEPHTH